MLARFLTAHIFSLFRDISSTCFFPPRKKVVYAPFRLKIWAINDFFFFSFAAFSKQAKKASQRQAEWGTKSSFPSIVMVSEKNRLYTILEFCLAKLKGALPNGRGINRRLNKERPKGEIFIFYFFSPSTARKKYHNNHKNINFRLFLWFTIMFGLILSSYYLNVPIGDSQRPITTVSSQYVFKTRTPNAAGRTINCRSKKRSFISGRNYICPPRFKENWRSYWEKREFQVVLEKWFFYSISLRTNWAKSLSPFCPIQHTWRREKEAKKGNSSVTYPIE